MKIFKLIAAIFVFLSALTLYAQVPDSPILVRPPIKPPCFDTPTFIWSETLQGTITYHIQVSNVSDFSSLVIDVSGITDVQYTPQNSLNSNTTYYWRVNASNSNGTSNWSNVGTITTQ